MEVLFVDQQNGVPQINEIECLELDTSTIASLDLMDFNCNLTIVLKARFLSSKSGEISYDLILGCIGYQLSA